MAGRGGRRSTTWTSSEQARAARNVAVELAKGMGERLSPAECVSLCQQMAPEAIEALRKALSVRGPTSVGAAKAILDRGYGAAPVKTEVTGPDGAPLQHAVAVAQRVGPSPADYLLEWAPAVAVVAPVVEGAPEQSDDAAE